MEPYIYLAIFALLSAAVAAEGGRAATLVRARPISAKAVYAQLARGQTKAQVVDVRPDLEDFEDYHIPGAMPFPDCQLEATPEAARSMIERTMFSVVVSEEGDPEVFERCKKYFKMAQNLEGGMVSWEEANLPEDGGPYEPPAPPTGGGCL